jgi:Flp pilus assembly protein TadG
MIEFATTISAPKKPRMHTRGSAGPRGAAVMEAVLVLSVILMLTLGAGQYGYVFFLKHTLQNAAGAGVRAAVVPNSTDAQVQAAVTQQLALAGMGNLHYTMTTTPSTMTGCASGTYVSVTITCTWGAVGISPLPQGMGGFASTKTFKASAMGLHE